PSGRRPTTRSVKLTLAGARSARADGTCSTAPRPFCLGDVGRLLGHASLELVLDLGKLVRFGLEIARVRPLEARLQNATHLPVSIAQMIVDGRVLGLELDRVLEVLYRLVKLADPIIRPAERIHDVAIIGTLLDGALD